MPRQNTSPANFPPVILAQIAQLAEQIVATRKARGETQSQWAEQLGISQPTMARLERGDPAIATATYVACLWQVNPQLNLLSLLAPAPAQTGAQTGAQPPTLASCTASTPSVADEFASLLAQWSPPAVQKPPNNGNGSTAKRPA